MWLVVLTILKRRVRQWEGLSHILWQIIQMFKPPSRNSQTQHHIQSGDGTSAQPQRMIIWLLRWRGSSPRASRTNVFLGRELGENQNMFQRNVRTFPWWEQTTTLPALARTGLPWNPKLDLIGWSKRTWQSNLQMTHNNPENSIVLWYKSRQPSSRRPRCDIRPIRRWSTAGARRRPESRPRWTWAVTSWPWFFLRYSVESALTV